MSADPLTRYLAEHPKMTGVLFSATVLLLQAGSAVASRSVGYPGP